MAPSPTGFFHVGSARTALYNWLFARHHSGTFILRVEDTDAARSSQDMIQVILDGLTWLGLNWDDEPYFQSRRFEIHKKCAKQLLDQGRAYYCFCDPGQLQKEKQQAYKNKKDWKYDRRCLHLNDAERAEKEEKNIPKAIRFLVPDGAVSYRDIVYGDISRNSRDIEDFVILRHDNTPTYNLACVVDDHDMGITHVIRGADHMTNTLKQLLLYDALNFDKPAFAHLPLILGPDKSKLSKRHGAVSLEEYRERGFLPDALVNYLALLGWSAGDDNEDFMNRRKPEMLGTVDKARLAKEFTLERVNKANAVFDMTKLEWMNQQYIQQLDPDRFQELLKPFIIKYELMTEDTIKKHQQRYAAICNLMHPRLKTLDEINNQARYFFKDDFEYDQPALQKFLNTETLDIIKMLIPVIQGINPFEAGQIEVALRNFGDDSGLKVKQWIHPLRVFTTGTKAGPPLFDTLELIGKDRCIKRIKNIVDKHGGCSE
jgi:glutamyl-tRNA synthetase